MIGTNRIEHLNVEVENAVRNYLYQYATEHPEWKANLVKDNKNMIDCINYIVSEAKKVAVKNVAIMTHESVYALAVKYYEDDSIVVEEEKPEPPAKTEKKSKAKKAEPKEDTPDVFSMGGVSQASTEESEKADAEGVSACMWTDEDEL